MRREPVLMARAWANEPDGPGVVAAVRAEGTAAGCRGRRRVVVGRRRAAVSLLVAAACVAGLALVVASLTRDADPFSGVWWEPSSGRRIEIVRAVDGYTLYYGAQRRPFSAERRGDGELRIAAPLGGDILVRPVADDRLELVDGGTATTLERLPSVP